MKLNAKVTYNIDFPPVRLTQSLEKIAKDIVIPLIKEGILTATDFSGRSFPDLSTATKKRKGHSRPLQETGKLLTSFKRKVVGKNVILIYISNARKKIAEYLQVDGVGKAGKRFRFMGVTQGMEKSAMKYMRKVIKKWVDNANR